MNSTTDDSNLLMGKWQLGGHIFPGIWRYLLPKEFESLHFPKERQASCMDCPKICSDNYRPDYRCCTYHPRVPNFNLGFALRTKEGRKGIDRAKGLGMLTPEGMNHSPEQYYDYLRDLKEEQFGKSHRVLCPMLDEPTGLCQIHAFRNSVCSTFFCIKDHDEKGNQFWSSVQVLGSQVEIAISQWSLEQVGFDLEGYIANYNKIGQQLKRASDPIHHGLSEASLKTLFGVYYQKEYELYKQCAKVVEAHKDVLWEIANEYTIKEALTYDKGVMKHVPKELRDEVDEEELEFGGDPITPDELWRKTVRKAELLWKLPKEPLTVSRRVRIIQNPLEHAIDKASDHLPYKVEVKVRAGSNTNEQVFYLSHQEKKLLELFHDPKRIGWELLSCKESKQLADPRGFLSELVGKKVLVRSS